ncbi:IS3 family transposase [Paenibacillus silvisoli]|uniref:IS3 family transposase n=1 Tax=Paenibacillus silvisoli TaxID=3110539 RepID=UPI003898DCC1
MSTKKRKNKVYSEELKAEAVRLYLEEGLSANQIADRFEIRSKTQMQQWIKKHLEGPKEDMRGKTAWRKGRPKTQFSSIEEELAYIKAENELPKKAVSKSTQGVTTKAARFSIIHEMRQSTPLLLLFELAEVSRAGYYKWLKSVHVKPQKQEDELLLKEHIMAIHRQRPYLGYFRVATRLRKEGFVVNHKRVYRLMKELGIRSVIRKKRRFFGKQASIVHPNRLDRQFNAETPLTKLVTDITYLRVMDTFYYLSAVLDLFNNEIVAWQLSACNDLDLVNSTLKQLHESYEISGCMLHSDQVFQYTSKSYNKKLEQYGIIGSHSRRGNCHDNACIESFFSHLKTESIYLEKPSNFKDLQHAVTAYIADYNHHRYQKKLNDRSPVEYREAVAA